MSTIEERIKQRFRTLATEAPLGPDRQYLRRACEILIDALAPELNRIDRAEDADAGHDFHEVETREDP